MHLTLDDYDLTIQEAKLSARAANPNAQIAQEVNQSALYWSVEVIGAYPVEYEGNLWWEEIRFGHDSFQIADLPRRWKNLVGLEIIWDGAHRNPANACNPLLYINFHEEITYSTLRFVEVEGRNIRIQWNGTVDKSPFSIDCWAVFEDVDVYCNEEDDAAAIQSILAAHLEPEDFTQQPKQPHYPTGALARFEPRI